MNPIRSFADRLRAADDPAMRAAMIADNRRIMQQAIDSEITEFSNEYNRILFEGQKQQRSGNWTEGAFLPLDITEEINSVQAKKALIDRFYLYWNNPWSGAPEAVTSLAQWPAGLSTLYLYLPPLNNSIAAQTYERTRVHRNDDM